MAIVKPDERVQIFTTAGVLDEAGEFWRIPVHIWLYEHDPTVIRRQLFALLLRWRYQLRISEQTDSNFKRRLGLLIADNERGKSLVAEIAGKRFPLNPTDALGHSTTHVLLARAELPPTGMVTVRCFGDQLLATGQILLYSETAPVLLSDIDDTVKVTQVGARALLMDRTFLQDFSAVPGMAEFYRHLSNLGFAPYFVSSSPWQLYAPLVEFLLAAGFPPAVLHLKRLRFRDRTLFNLFKSGLETKPQQISALFESLQPRKFLLVGDNGEEDPEVYEQILRQHPDQVIAVMIRNVREESVDLPRYRYLQMQLGSLRFALFNDIAAVERQIIELVDELGTVPPVSAPVDAKD